jgi:imidazolonepropionase-like amidohydrolase
MRGGFPMGLVLKSGNLIDGTGKMIKDAVVVTEGSTIVTAGPTEEVKIPEGAHEEIDATGMTIMPGLMDCHVHLHGDGRPDGFLTTADSRTRLVDEVDAYLAIVMAKHAEMTLPAGFTTIREMAAPNDINIQVRRAVENGYILGPRILATVNIGMTGREQVHGGYRLVTGPDEARRAVRETAIDADVVHVIATGSGVGKLGFHVLMLTVEEMRAAIEEAHKLGKKTSAHACGIEGIRNAILAGTDCIEHGQFLCRDDDVIRMMVDRRVGYVPTLTVNYFQLLKEREAQAEGRRSGVSNHVLRRAAQVIEPHRRSYEKAMEAGVLVANGTDVGSAFQPSGTNAYEMEMFVKYGATPMQAIEAATRLAAEVLGLDDRLGTVEAGKEADLIVVRKDPLEDIRTLQEHENILLVIKGGEIAVDRRDRPERK